MKTGPDIPERAELFGVPVDMIGSAEACAASVEMLLKSDRCNPILAVNPEKVIAARRNPRLLDALRQASLLLPDGIGVVIACRLLRLGRPVRTTGIDTMAGICAGAARAGRSIYLLGGRDEVNRLAAEKLTERFPPLLIAGRRDGYFDEAAETAIVEDINRSGAEILFVALGSPKQELWIARNRTRLQPRICQGIGGSLDVFAGRVERAPRLFLALNLEWLYRLLKEPRRIARQKALPMFAWLVLKRLLGFSADNARTN